MYSQTSDLKLLLSERELVQLAADSRGQSFDDEAVLAVLAEAIDQADGEIDAYVAAILAVPLQEPPRLISNISAKIAVYNLMRRRPSIPKFWETEYERCLKLLERISEGKIRIGAQSATEPLAENDSGGLAVVTAIKSWS